MREKDHYKLRNDLLRKITTFRHAFARPIPETQAEIENVANEMRDLGLFSEIQYIQSKYFMEEILEKKLNLLDNKPKNAYIKSEGRG